VRTSHPDTGKTTIYLPGSSLKGALRSHVERIIRAVHGDSEIICCDPLSRHRNRSCGTRTDRIADTAEQYRELCLACRLFGHTVHASHFRISDAYPATAINLLPVRHQVAIDRLSGSVANGPFDLEVAETGRFFAHISVVNFERWQIGLLALALRDLSMGQLQLGFGKSRGFGQVVAHFGQMRFSYPGRFSADGLSSRVLGIGALAPDLVDAYGLCKDDASQLPVEGVVDAESVTWGCPTVHFGAASDRSLFDLDDEALSQAHGEIVRVLASLVGAWADYRLES
jgi:CRISPR-associated protein Csm3